MVIVVLIIVVIYLKKVDFEVGKDYYWCCCGCFKFQLFCDGLYVGIGIIFLKFIVEKMESVMFC